MVIGLFIDLVIWFLVWFWSGCMVTGLVIWLLVSFYGYWFWLHGH